MVSCSGVDMKTVDFQWLDRISRRDGEFVCVRERGCGISRYEGVYLSKVPALPGNGALEGPGQSVPLPLRGVMLISSMLLILLKPARLPHQLEGCPGTMSALLQTVTALPVCGFQKLGQAGIQLS